MNLYKVSTNVFSFYSNQAASSNILSEPQIAWRIQDFGSVIDQLILNCTVNVTSLNRFEMNWELPNQNIAKKVRRSIQKSDNLQHQIRNTNCFFFRKIEYKLFQQF